MRTLSRAPRRASGSLLTVGALAALGAGLAAAGDPPPEAAPPLDSLARALVEKRSEVERLSTQVELEKAALRDALRGLAQRKADLERQAQALERELAHVREAAEAKASAVGAKRAARELLEPVLRQQLEALAVHVERGLPFHREERRAEVAELRRSLDAAEVAPDEVLGRLWSAIEDELRLTRDSGLYRQPVELDGEAVLADVVRLGMVLLYFRTQDGRYGYAAPAADGWRFVALPEGPDQARLAALFEAHEKHVREGFFMLPNPYAGAREEAR